MSAKAAAQKALAKARAQEREAAERQAEQDKATARRHKGKEAPAAEHSNSDAQESRDLHSHCASTELFPKEHGRDTNPGMVDLELPAVLPDWQALPVAFRVPSAARAHCASRPVSRAEAGVPAKPIKHFKDTVMQVHRQLVHLHG